MSSSEEKVVDTAKRNADIDLLRQLALNTKRSKDETMEYDRLLNLYGQKIINNPELLQEQQSNVVYIMPEVPKKNTAQTKNDMEALIIAYQEKTGREAQQTPQGIMLSFNNQEEAVAFFKEQSKTLAFKMYDKKNDHYVYSDGKGTFVHGTKQQVNDYLKNPQEFKLGEDGKLDKKDALEETEEDQKSMKL